MIPKQDILDVVKQLNWPTRPDSEKNAFSVKPFRLAWSISRKTISFSQKRFKTLRKSILELKGLKKRPKIKPSGMEKKTNNNLESFQVHSQLINAKHLLFC